MRNFECGRPLLEWSLPVAHLLGLTQNFEYGRPSLGGYCRDRPQFLVVRLLVLFVRVVVVISPAFHVGEGCQQTDPLEKQH